MESVVVIVDTMRLSTMLDSNLSSVEVPLAEDTSRGHHVNNNSKIVEAEDIRPVEDTRSHPCNRSLGYRAPIYRHHISPLHKPRPYRMTQEHPFDMRLVLKLTTLSESTWCRLPAHTH